MLNEIKEKTIESVRMELSKNESQKDFKKDKIFLSMYIVFSILSSFLLGFMICKYWQIEYFKSPVYYSEFK